MRDGGVLQVQPLRSLRLQSNAISAHSQQLRYAYPNRQSMWSNLWSSQDQAGIKIRHAISRIVYALQRFAQKDNRIRALPLRIRGRKERADIRRSHGPKQRVSDGMQKHIAIRVPAQTSVMGKQDAANLQRNPWLEFVRVKAVPDSQRQPLSRCRFTRINADFLSFILVNQPSKLRRISKVQQQTNLDICRAQVVQQLLFVGLINGTCCLEFKQNLPIYEHVRAEISNLLTTEPNRYWHLPLQHNPGLRESER
jgi:hypothetical protein